MDYSKIEKHLIPEFKEIESELAGLKKKHDELQGEMRALKLDVATISMRVAELMSVVKEALK